MMAPTDYSPTSPVGQFAIHFASYMSVRAHFRTAVSVAAVTSIVAAYLLLRGPGGAHSAVAVVAAGMSILWCAVTRIAVNGAQRLAADALAALKAASGDSADSAAAGGA